MELQRYMEGTEVCGGVERFMEGTEVCGGMQRHTDAGVYGGT